MGFHDFVGNTSILESIQQQLSENRIPSSVLFTGISGIGKWTLAHYISKALNCKEFTNDFCDSCTSCLIGLSQLGDHSPLDSGLTAGDLRKELNG